MKSKKTPGQVVVIVTIFIAVIILLAIVLINIGKITDIKTATSQIADRGALGLCSQLSAYVNVLRLTLAHKAQATTPFGTGFGCWGSELTITCLNWGLIIPLIGLLVSIVMMAFPPTLPVGIVLSFVAINPLLNEVNEIMRSGFNNASAEFTQYSGMRESAISSMLSLAQADPEKAVRIPGTDIFKYVYDHRWDPVEKKYIEVYYEYNIVNSPIAAKYKKYNTLPRYAAWYWAKRYMTNHVSEKELTPLINVFVDDLVKITEFNHWDPAKWIYTEVSFKVTDPNITCGGDTCPEWAVVDKGITRILSHVTQKEENILTWIMNFLTGIFGGGPQGFLPVKFNELTKHLKENPTYGGYITWDGKDINTVTEALRGLMLRDMELLNLPVSARIPTIDNWLPIWYNKNDHSQDIYTRINDMLNGSQGIKGINEWISVLESIYPDMRTNIQTPYGDNHYAKGDYVQYCWHSCIKCCCDCPCECCGADWGPCDRAGIFCTACGTATPPVCGRHDLYNTTPGWCPLVFVELCFPPCDCGDNPYCHDACQFQGMDGYDSQGPTEVEQALKILHSLKDALIQLQMDIQTFANMADVIMNPGAAVQEVQKQAVYGWNDKNGNLNLARVRLDNYPARNQFPYIKESFIFGGVFKKWEILNPVSGSIDVKVSRYTSDISAGWWNLRFRKNPGSNEWDRGALATIIKDIHETGICHVSEGDLDIYAITSGTKGHWGMKKEEIRIDRNQ